MILRGIKRSRLWSLAIALLMAAQVGLALHSLHHHFKADALTSSENCGLCQVAATMTPPPAVVAVIPAGEAIAVVSPIVAVQPVAAAPAAAFRSRAPPVSVSA